MKNNQPVTGKEVDFRIDANILSTTNLKGSITYANPDFVDISGFTLDELLGKNHNVVRHPDMPPAAYESLWGEIKEGRPWMGIVKNRCKNGDHYWVDAYVTPIQQDGETVEYQSVRYKPEDDCVERAEKLYQNINEGKSVAPNFWDRLDVPNRQILGNLITLIPALATVLIEGTQEYIWLGFLVTALLIIVFNTISLSPLKNLVKIAKEIFDNPLMSKIYTGRDDDFGHLQLALKMRRSQVNAVVGRISDTSRILTETSSVTSQSAEQSLDGVYSQLSEITHITTAMNEMSLAVKEVAENASLTADSTESSRHKSGEGQERVTQTIDAINDLSTRIQESSDVITHLSEYSADIGGILSVIKGVAEQTNLLALNAAIEAARAGEHGRGFAVVADEVRSLASRTSESTREIEAMIDQIQSGTSNAVIAMNNSRDKANECMDIASSAGKSLREITDSINTISEMNFQVATATEQQSAVAAEIQRNLGSIKEVAEETSQGAENSSKASREIMETISQLKALIRQFLDKRT